MRCLPTFAAMLLVLSAPTLAQTSSLVPLAGDWDGDGDDTVGLYHAPSGGFYLRNSNSGGAPDIVFQFGATGAATRPIAGDWDDNGVDTVGVVDTASGTWSLRNSNSGGGADLVFTFDFQRLPIAVVAGDWNASAADTPGVFALPLTIFGLRNSNSGGDPTELALLRGPTLFNDGFDLRWIWSGG